MPTFPLQGENLLLARGLDWLEDQLKKIMIWQMQLNSENMFTKYAQQLISRVSPALKGWT